jgi:hypothetical protein
MLFEGGSVSGTILCLCMPDWRANCVFKFDWDITYMRRIFIIFTLEMRYF